MEGCISPSQLYTTLKIKSKIKLKIKLFGWLFGETESPSRVITISTKKPDGSKLSKDEIELTVLHEIVHSIFQTGQYMSCDNDEPLVEWTARCLKTLKKQHII